jgi:hypothetical protein
LDYRDRRGGARPGAGRKRVNDRKDIRIRKGQSFRLHAPAYPSLDGAVVHIERMSAGETNNNVVGTIRLTTHDGQTIDLVEVMD